MWRHHFPQTLPNADEGRGELHRKNFPLFFPNFVRMKPLTLPIEGNEEKIHKSRGLKRLSGVRCRLLREVGGRAFMRKKNGMCGENLTVS